MEIRNVTFGGGLSMVLTPSASGLFTAVTNIVEGNSFIITFTTNRPGSFGYTITGVSSADIGNASLTGTFTANGETRTYTVSDDLVTEGAETFVMSLDNGQARAPVVIDDAYYTLTANVASANEGNVFRVTLDTNAIHALPLGYTITGVSSGDLIGYPSLTGNFTSNGQVLTYTANADVTTEGIEYFAISLNNGRANANVTINDTSIPYYILTANVSSVNETGSNTFAVTLVTNVGFPIPYTITGSNVTASDFVSNTLTGNFTANNQTINFAISEDGLTEGTEIATLTLSNNVANVVITILNTSNTGSQVEYTTPGTYSWTAPEGITKVSVVAIGGGGGSNWGGNGGVPRGGAGGGGLGWKNAITVVPGTSYTVVVGGGGGIYGEAGNDSYFISTSTVKGGGGAGAIYNGGNAAGGGYTGDGGGNGGAGSPTPSGDIGGGGGGGGGYTGAGGAGGAMGNGGVSTGGGGGGGGGNAYFRGGGGGGTGIYGAGSNGTAGASAGGGQAGGGGGGGSNGQAGNGQVGGSYGGGGGASADNWGWSGGGAGGAVRIIWGGAGRGYPSNAANV
jgi:hypothetical protein